MRVIKVLIVDDSAFMRKSLSMMLESDPEIKVAATARNGSEALEKIQEHKPDIVTLDIEMPVMDGLTALEKIMKDMPLPVLMVSSLTTEGAKATLDAMNLGAVDFIPKQLSYVSLDIVKIKDELIQKVKLIVRNRSLRQRLERIKSGGVQTAPVKKSTNLGNLKRPIEEMAALVVGVSTGGPNALLKIIPQLPASFPLGVAVVQHMPPHFTKSMAERLNSISNLHIKEAEEGDYIERGVVLIAPGGKQMTFKKNGVKITANISVEPQNTLYKPSADIMIASAADVYKRPLLGLILTGMGKDGLEGLKLVKQKKGYIIAQDEESCIVYGMPKAVVDEGISDAVLSLEEIPHALIRLTNNTRYYL